MLHLSKSSRAISLFLCLAFLLLAGCGAGAVPSGADSTGAGESEAASGSTSASTAPAYELEMTSRATGRYVERKVDIPSFTSMYFSQTAPNTCYVLGDIKTDAGYEMQVWCSTDGGSTWKQAAPSWLAELNALQENDGGWISAAAFVSDTEAYLFYGNHAADGSRQNHLAHADDSGVSVIGEPEQEVISNLAVCANGDLLVGTYSHTEQRNLQTGKKTSYSFVAEEGSARSPGVFTTYDSTLAVYTDENKIELYDLASGKKTTEIPCQADLMLDRVITVGADKKSFFFCDPSGLYRMTMDGTLTELLMDGKLASFSGDDAVISRVVTQDDGSFLVLCLVDQFNYELYRYSYDEAAPTTPSEALTVYSLNDSVGVQMAVSAFKQENPDTLVEYQAGIPFDSGILVPEIRLLLE